MPLHVTLDVKTLGEALGRLTRTAAGRSAALPVLQYLHLEAGAEVRLTTTNLDLALTGAIPGMVLAPGAICLPVAQLAAMVGKLPPGLAAIEVAPDGCSVQVSMGKIRFSLPALGAGEFPTVPALSAWRSG